MASIGSIVGGGFRLITEQPAAVGIWALVNLVVAVATQLLTYGLIPASGDPSAGFAAAMGMLLPMWILGIVVYVVLLCAAYRAVLRPGEGGLGYMRFGGDELRVLVVLILLGVGIFIGYLLLLLVTVFIASILGFAMGQSAAIVLLLLYLFLLAVVIFFWVKLSLIAPVTFARRKLAFDEGWGLTRGRFWTLFIAYLLIAIVTIIIYAAAYYPIYAPMIAAYAGAWGDPVAMENAQANVMAAQMNQAMPVLIGLSALGAVAQAVTLALGAGATATAARELMHEAGMLSEEDVERTAEIFE